MMASPVLAFEPFILMLQRDAVSRPVLRRPGRVRARRRHRQPHHRPERRLWPTAGYDTHLWFVGEPDLAGHESRGQLAAAPLVPVDQPLPPARRLRRRGRQGAATTPRRCRRIWFARRCSRTFARRPRRGPGRGVAHRRRRAAPRLAAARRRGFGDSVTILWNANNTFGFERIDWPRLRRAAIITTVSRYMSHCMCARASTRS